jgi:hypothetical protein
MMAYIDWDFEKVRRTDAQVKRQLENDGKEATRRGMGGYFEASRRGHEGSRSTLFLNIINLVTFTVVNS